MNALLTLILSVFAVAAITDVFTEGVAMLIKGIYRHSLADDVADGIVAAWREMLDY